jgi:hypothetical protein
MRRSALAFAMIASAVIAPIVPACSSTPAASSDTDAGGDSAIGPGQLVGSPCDPTLSNPCLQAPCSSVECNPLTGTCESTPLTGPCQVSEDASFDFEAGSDSGTPVSSGCSSDFQCPTIPPGLDGGTPIVMVCAFSVIDGCGATGICVIPEPPQTTDGAFEIACGCNGQPVTYVTDDQTAAPVSSGVPCAAVGGTDAGLDAGPDAGDAGSDAMSDASDASEDAMLDAPTDG